MKIDSISGLKGRWLIIVVGTVVLVALIAGLLIRQHSKKTTAPDRVSNLSHTAVNTKASGANSPAQGRAQSTASQSQNPACKLLTLQDAVATIGAGAKYETSTKSPTSNAAITSYSCVYTTGGKVLSLQVREASRAEGRQAVVDAFDASDSSDATNVPNLGQKAFAVKAASEIDVLNNDVWYTITEHEGAGAPPVSEEMLQKIVNRVLKNA